MEDLVQSELQKARNEYTFHHTGYHSLCSAFNTLRNLDCFVIFLGTDPCLVRYSLSQQQFWSSRSRNTPIDSLQAPFVELPFDTWSSPCLVAEDIQNLDDVCKIEFMVRFGRPL